MTLLSPFFLLKAQTDRIDTRGGWQEDRGCMNADPEQTKTILMYNVFFFQSFPKWSIEFKYFLSSYNDLKLEYDAIKLYHHYTVIP